MSKKVFLGVGHGGTDPGAVGFLIEKDVNLTMAIACRDFLVDHGVDVRMSRTVDENDPLTEVINECNTFNPDLAADIHNNAGQGDGFEVFYHYKGGTSKTLAKNIEKEVIDVGQNSRGLKTKLNSSGTDYFGFIRQTTAPAVILEGVFVDNKTDVQIADELHEQQAFGKAYAKGILKTLGIEIKESEPKTDNLYRVQVGAFKEKQNADNLVTKLKNQGYSDAFIKQNDDGLYRVQVGAFSIKSNAENLLKKLKGQGYSDAFIKTV